MAVIAVINRKGGSGKSTLATQLAGYFANTGAAVLLGDLDRQQSTQVWLRQRKARQLADASSITAWNIDPRSFVRPPSAIDHVIVDTPGGLRGFDLARVVMYADAILIPVCSSAFDRESAAECVAELRALPRVASGRCRLAVVGMRLDARTHAAQTLQAWAADVDVAFITVLRETQTYVRCIDKGLSLFDLPPTQVQADVHQWAPILDWLRPLMQPADQDTINRFRAQRHPAATESKIAPPIARPREADGHFPQRVAAPIAPRPAGSSTLRRLRDALPIPRFLQRTP